MRVEVVLKAWAISMAMGPPPIMTMLRGARSISKTVSLVRNPASLSPSISGVSAAPCGAREDERVVVADGDVAARS